MRKYVALTTTSLNFLNLVPRLTFYAFGNPFETEMNGNPKHFLGKSILTGLTDKGFSMVEFGDIKKCREALFIHAFPHL